MMDAQKALEILLRIPNIEPIWFYSCTYDELVDMYDYKVFPISEEEVNDLKEFIKNNYTLNACIETFMDNVDGYDYADEEEKEDEDLFSQYEGNLDEDKEEEEPEQHFESFQERIEKEIVKDLNKASANLERIQKITKVALDKKSLDIIKTFDKVFKRCYKHCKQEIKKAAKQGNYSVNIYYREFTKICTEEDLEKINKDTLFNLLKGKLEENSFKVNTEDDYSYYSSAKKYLHIMWD